MEVRPERRLLGLAQVRRLAGQRMEQHAAQRVDVGARVDPLAADLLGRDVAQRPDPLARAAQPGAGADALREAEVRQVGVVTRAEPTTRLALTTTTWIFVPPRSTPAVTVAGARPRAVGAFGRVLVEAFVCAMARIVCAGAVRAGNVSAARAPPAG